MTGFALAMVACGGILGQRLSRGDVRTALLAHVLFTGVVLGLMPSERAAAPERFFSFRRALQLVGGAAGIALAHGLLRSSVLGSFAWLSEAPAQLVNDAVAVFAPLAVVWAANRRPPSTIGLVVTLALVTGYRATGSMWHLDAAHSSYTVQDFVTGEFAGSAVGIAMFRLLVPGWTA